MTLFKDRREAGCRLAKKLIDYRKQGNVIVLALPRGGLPIGFEIAKQIEARLDVFLVRKLGAPQQPELAMGAIASGGITVMNAEVLRMLNLSDEAVNQVIEEEKRELQRRQKVYRGDQPFPDLNGKVAILVDDGIATGATMKVAVKAIRSRVPDRMVVAVPVGPKSTCDALRDWVDESVCLETPVSFQAIGQWYADFSQLDDQDVRDYLETASALTRLN
jgi:predicted phosphoribosyltransferase